LIWVCSSGSVIGCCWVRVRFGSQQLILDLVDFAGGRFLVDLVCCVVVVLDLVFGQWWFQIYIYG